MLNKGTVTSFQDPDKNKNKKQTCCFPFFYHDKNKSNRFDRPLKWSHRQVFSRLAENVRGARAPTAPPIAPPPESRETEKMAAVPGRDAWIWFGLVLDIIIYDGGFYGGFNIWCLFGGFQILSYLYKAFR